jgi:hypothetical protein
MERSLPSAACRKSLAGRLSKIIPVKKKQPTTSIPQKSPARTPGFVSDKQL